VAVCCFSLDRFQAINDTLGHTLGDQVLQQLASRARAIAGDEAELARLGGDNFAVLFVGNDAAHRVARFCRTMLESAARPIAIEAHRASVGLSFGYATSDAVHGSAQAILSEADTALHRAKSAGGNTIVSFSPHMLSGIVERQALETDLWHGLTNGEFEVVYQPQYRLSDLSICGAEALVRWNHPVRGLVSPAEFVPVAEAVGSIVPLGSWILSQACADAATWAQPVSLSVNVSPVQFARADLVVAVEEALRVSKLRPERLGLEITESAFFERNRAAHNTLAQLKALGVKIILDDFGTGYSSLSYVRDLRADKIKIDRSFVRGLPGDPESAAIVNAIATIAKGLRLQLNAEGAETQAQFDFLKGVGCDELQGFLLGKAMSAAEFGALLATSAPRTGISAA
jgi:diguanylate cyclase (GGDEF)-like protein